MIYEIRDRKPELVRFVVDEWVVTSIHSYMETRRYELLMCCYGHQFLLEIMKMFEDAENYEECDEIVRQINTFNKLISEKLTTKHENKNANNKKD